MDNMTKDNMALMQDNKLQRKNTYVAVVMLSIAVGMVGMSYAAVPLYELFCQVTGYEGTTQRADAAPETVLNKKIRVRFDANIAGDLGWDFKPVQNLVDIKLGENKLAFYSAKNTSGVPLTGMAKFKVMPEIVGSYFNKIECFCFTEQTLQPGQSIEMPVSFFIDPEIANDPSANQIKEITLSYVFRPINQKLSSLGKTEDKTKKQ